MHAFLTRPENRIERVLFWLMWFLRFDIVGGIAWMVIIGNWEAFFINIAALVLTFMPAWVSIRYKVRLPIDYVFLIVLFIYLSMFLGSIYDAYERIFWWDALLHVASGAMLSYGAFLVLYVLMARKKMTLTPFLVAVFTFSFGLAVGTIWEIFEFGVDSIFGTNMQRSGLQDTMWDLIVDAFGSLLIAWVAYDIVKNDKTEGFMYSAIRRFMRNNE